LAVQYAKLLARFNRLSIFCNQPYIFGIVFGLPVV
jgi:hypothetical protein